MENNNRSVFKAILFSILMFIAFYLSAFILKFIFEILFYFLLLILSKIPILNMIIRFLFKDPDASPELLPLGAAISISYLGIVWIAEKLIKYDSTRSLALRITGIIMIVVNVLLFFINIIVAGYFFTNIILILVGISFIKKDS